ncbi:MAG: hypothetical protein K2L96_06060 [Muribaculaceae bacterium]|nr:hypothetical protein [Muribaculaceae bacterium]
MKKNRTEAVLIFMILCALRMGAQSMSASESVDLGLPSGTIWANCNVGASTPYDYGNYYQWGELTPFTGSDYSYQQCRLNNKQVKDISGDKAYDVATFAMGDSWQLPTKEDFEELLDYCEWTYVYEDGMKGYELTGPNGKTMFLPSGGIVYEMGLSADGTTGSYWTSTPYGKDTHLAYAVGFRDPWDADTGEESDEDSRTMAGSERHFGLSVRPVLRK